MTLGSAQLPPAFTVIAGSTQTLSQHYTPVTIINVCSLAPPVRVCCFCCLLYYVQNHRIYFRFDETIHIL